MRANTHITRPSGAEERARVKEIEICVVTAGQLRHSDKQPRMRRGGRAISLKQTLADYLHTPSDRGEKGGPISVGE